MPTRPSRRACARAWAACLPAVLLAACGAGQGSVPASSPSGEVAASPATDREAVEQAVRAYFEAVANDDPAGKIAHSAGDLQAVAEWEQQVSIAFGSTFGTLEVQRLEAKDVGQDRATVDFSAEFRPAGFEDDPPTAFAGPVVLAREAGGWKVVDYVRDGRSRSASVFTAVRGSAEAGGLTLEVTGVDLPTGAVLVVFRVTNRTEEAYTVIPATLVAEDGRRLEFGEPSATQRAVLPSAPLESYLYWSGRDLPEDTGGFRLLVDLAPTGSGSMVHLDVPVTLID